MERDWEYLPKHLLDSVVEKLLIAPDYLGFSLVCKSWYSVAKYNKSKYATMTAPLLVFYTRRKDYWKVYNVVERKVLDFQVRMPNRGLVGSSKGWLIFVHRNDADNTFGLTLVNPFLRVRGRKPKENSLIRLPPLKSPDYKIDWDFVTRATISADPILDANNCIVMASHMHKNTLAFIRLGKDTTWTYVEKSVPNAVCGCGMIEEIANVGNKIYTLNYWSELVSFDVTSRSYSDVKLVRRGFRPDRYPLTKRYMFEGEDHKLLMILRYIKNATKGRRTTRFTVFEFNFQTGEWTKKNTLGNVAVFVGDNASVCVLAPNSFGFQSNCIYFNHDHDYVGNHYRAHDFGLYNVEDQSFPESYTDEAIDLLENSYPLPIWVVPTLTFPL